MLSEFLKDLEGLQKEFLRNGSVNINSSALKTRATELVKKYFSVIRITLQSDVAPPLQSEIDSLCQDLLRLAQGNNAKKSYLKILADLKTACREANITLISRPITPQEKKSLSAEEESLLSTLEGLLPSAAASYWQALEDLSRATTRRSFRGVACELREAFRETIDHLAPDVDVLKQKDFTLEKGKQAPTMKQKVRFILKQRGQGESRRATAEKTTDLIEEFTGEIARATYGRASQSTHSDASLSEVIAFKKYINVVLSELLMIPIK